MNNSTIISVLRLRNKNNVIYFRDSQDANAAEMRDKMKSSLFHAHLYHYPVNVHFPECLFTGRIIPRNTEYCQWSTVHTVFLVENGYYVAYFQTIAQAESAMALHAELAGSKITETTVTIQDIEALCHGVPTAILNDTVRAKLFGNSMTPIVHEDARAKIELANSYHAIETDNKIESDILSQELSQLQIETKNVAA